MLDYLYLTILLCILHILIKYTQNYITTCVLNSHPDSPCIIRHAQMFHSVVTCFIYLEMIITRP